MMGWLKFSFFRETKGTVDASDDPNELLEPNQFSFEDFIEKLELKLRNYGVVSVSSSGDRRYIEITGAGGRNFSLVVNRSANPQYRIFIEGMKSAQAGRKLGSHVLQDLCEVADSMTQGVGLSSVPRPADDQFIENLHERRRDWLLRHGFESQRVLDMNYVRPVQKRKTHEQT